MYCKNLFKEKQEGCEKWCHVQHFHFILMSKPDFENFEYPRLTSSLWFAIDKGVRQLADLFGTPLSKGIYYKRAEHHHRQWANRWVNKETKMHSRKIGLYFLMSLFFFWKQQIIALYAISLVALCTVVLEVQTTSLMNAGV